MALIHTWTALFAAEHPRLLSCVRKRAADWLVRICAGNEYGADPTAQFSLRAWADLPTHHPAPDE